MQRRRYRDAGLIIHLPVEQILGSTLRQWMRLRRWLHGRDRWWRDVPDLLRLRNMIVRILLRRLSGAEVAGEILLL